MVHQRWGPAGMPSEPLITALRPQCLLRKLLSLLFSQKIKILEGLKSHHSHLGLCVIVQGLGSVLIYLTSQITHN